jgi:hypothetical protein
MSAQDKMLLSPWRKWRKYNRVPWKIALHLLLCGMVVAYAMLLYVTVNRYSRGNISTLSYHIIANSDSQVFEIYDVADFRRIYARIVSSFFGAGLIGAFSPLQHPDSSAPAGVASIRMDMQVYTSSLLRNASAASVEGAGVVPDNSIQTFVYFLTASDPDGPFAGLSDDATIAYIHRISSVRFDYFLENAYMTLFDVVPCIWHVEIGIEQTNGIMLFSLQPHIESLEMPVAYFIVAISFNAVLAVLAMVSAVLSAKSVYSRARLYFRVRRDYCTIPADIAVREDYPDWKEYPWSVPLAFVHVWDAAHVPVTLTLITAMLLNIMDLFDWVAPLPTNILLAIAAAGITVNLLRYFEYLRDFYVLLSTLRIAGVYVFRFFITAFPIYFSYVLMGVLLFSPYSFRFESITMTSITLFTVVSGDSIHAAFEGLLNNYPYPIVCQLYLYSFVALFITSILPLFMFIINDGYIIAKERSEMSEEDEQDFSSPAAAVRLRAADAAHPWEDRNLLDLRIIFRILRRENAGHGSAGVVNTNASASSAVRPRGRSLSSSTGLAVPATDEEDSLLVQDHSMQDMSVGGGGIDDNNLPPGLSNSAVGARSSALMRQELRKLEADVRSQTKRILEEFAWRQNSIFSERISALDAELRSVMEREMRVALNNLFDGAQVTRATADSPRN